MIPQLFQQNHSTFGPLATITERKGQDHQFKIKTVFSTLVFVGVFMLMSYSQTDLRFQQNFVLCLFLLYSWVTRFLLRGTDICRIFLFLPSILLSSVRIKHLWVQTQHFSIVSAQRLICVERMNLCFVMHCAEGVSIS